MRYKEKGNTFFVDYPLWREEFAQVHANERYFTQRLRAFMLEHFLLEIRSALPYELTLEVVKKGIALFHYDFLTDKSAFVESQWPEVIFWLVESGYWPTTLTRQTHFEAIQDYGTSFVRDYETLQDGDYEPRRWALMLLKEGCSPAQLGAHNVQAKIMRMTGHSSEYVHEFYNPPRLVWGHELLASNPFVHDSQFLYPSTSLEP